MTTLAMIGGMTPTALALSEGSETRAPMAIAVIGGLALVHDADANRYPRNVLG